MVVHDQHCRLHRIQVSHGACPSASVLPPVPNNQRVVGAPMPRTAPNWSIDASHAHPPTGGRSMNLTGGDLKSLTPRGLQGLPAYSPDGSTIVFDRSLPHEDALWLMRSNGSGLRQLTHNRPAGKGECRCEGSPVFSPDGMRIAFVRTITELKTAVFVVNDDGSGLKQITPWHLGVS